MSLYSKKPIPTQRSELSRTYMTTFVSIAKNASIQSYSSVTRIGFLLVCFFRRDNHTCRMGIWDNQNRASCRIWDTVSAAGLLPVYPPLKRIQAFCTSDNCRYQLPLILRTNLEGLRESNPSGQAAAFQF